MKTIGFLDYYLDEWHAEQYPSWIEEASGGTMRVAYAYAMVDAEGGVDNRSWCQQRDIQLLGSVQEVVEKSDYLIVLSPDNPEYHWTLAELPLQSGKPTYVDKTFAPNALTACSLFELAEKHSTPVYSSSALRFASEYASLQKSGIEIVSSIGPGRYENYTIHQIEPIVALMGTDVKRVMFVGTPQNPSFIYVFACGRQARIQHLRNSPFALSISYETGEFAQVTVQSDYFSEFIKNMVGFFESGIPSVQPVETMTIMAMIDGGYEAQKRPGQWVDVIRY